MVQWLTSHNNSRRGGQFSTQTFDPFILLYFTYNNLEIKTDQDFKVETEKYNLLPNWTLIPILTLLPNCGGFHRTLQRVRLANRGRLLLRTPVPVPFGTCICSHVEIILSRTCHVYAHPSVLLFCSLEFISACDWSKLSTLKCDPCIMIYFFYRDLKITKNKMPYIKFHHGKRDYFETFSNSNVNYFWSIKHSSEVIEKLRLRNFHGSQISSFEFYFIHILATWSYQSKSVVSC